MSGSFFPGNSKVILGDCFEVIKNFPDNSIDLIFTDPPYLKKYLPLYKRMAEEFPRIMKDGASLVTIVGHYAIPYVLEVFKNKLKYRWILCLNQFDGKHARMAMGIEVMWKPMLWFVKRAYPHGRGFLRDGIKITGTAGQTKHHHKWEQDISWCEYYVKRLCPENGVVLDPFCGSGTVGVACQKLGRRFILIDNDEKAIKTTRQRLGM